MTFDIDRYRKHYPFTSHYYEIAGHRYHYLDEGQGEPVVMVHGNPTWSFYFRELIKALSPHYRVIVPDHIGCGLSDKPTDDKYQYLLRNRVDDLEALLIHLKIERDVNLVVHDWGGMIGMAYAVRHPQAIKRLVITNTAAFLMPRGKRLPWQLWLIRQILPFATVAVRGFNIFSRLATVMATHRGLSPEIKRGLTAPYDSWHNRIATLRFVQDIPLIPTDPSYQQVLVVDQSIESLFSEVPMLICWGMHDFVFDRDYLHEWQQRFPKAQVHKFYDAGHYVLEDACQQVIEKVEQFLTMPD